MSSVTWLRTKHGMLLSLLAAAITLVCASSGHLSLADDAEQPSQGLRGILPEFVPLGLLEDDFLILGESWTAWSKDAAADVAALYEQEDLDVAGQRAALEKLEKRIRTMEKALANKAYAAIFEPLATINGRLSRRVSVATAILDTLEINPETAHKAKVDAAGAEVAQSVESLGKYLSKIKNGDAWLKYIRAEELRSAVKSAESSEVVSAVFTRLSESDKMQNDAQRKFVERPQFLTVKQTLGQYLELASAEAPAKNDQSELRGSLRKLVSSLEAYEHAARFRRQPPVTLTVRFAIWQQTVATTWLTSWPVSISTTTCELWRRNRFSTKSLATNTQIQAWSTTWFWEPKSTVTRPRRAPLEST